MPRAPVVVLMIPAGTGLLYGSVCIGQRRPLVSGSILLLAFSILLDSRQLWARITRKIIHVGILLLLMLALASPVRPSQGTKMLTRAFKIPAGLGLLLVAVAVLGYDSGMEADLVFVPLVIGYFALLIAWAMWMHHERSRIKFVLLGVGSVHVIQAGLYLVPPHHKALAPWIVALPAIIFYGAISCVLCMMAYQKTRELSSQSSEQLRSVVEVTSI